MKWNSKPARFRPAITIVELMVVLGILSLLLQMMLPAVLAARSAARRLMCARNLRQLSRAALVHHDTQNQLPSGGWHFTWVGEPERGTGVRQPGGWAFNLLEYLDDSALRSMGRGTANGYARAAAIRERCRTPLAQFICPARRSAAAYPHQRNHQPWTRGGALAIPLELAAKTDYAANVGDGDQVEFDWQWPGPTSLAEGDDPDFEWPRTASFTGVIYGRSRVRMKQVRDGASRTYLFGEKYMDASHYETGEDWGDNENLFAGFNNDSCRSTQAPPQRDQRGVDYRNQFGSAHQHVWQAAYCDGSVHALSFDMDVTVHRQLGNIADGPGIADGRAR